MASAADKLTWLASETGGPGWFRNVDRFRIGDVEFDCSFERGSKPDRFYIRKHRGQVEAFLAVLDLFPNANVAELGIMEGGSTALAALAGTPRKLVSLELEPKRVAALDELVARHGLEKRVRPYYGVDQADRDRLRAIITEEFAPESLDLVIDDASHLLEPTRASFETLFPHLREGRPLFDRGLEVADPDGDRGRRTDARIRPGIQSEAKTQARCKTDLGGR